jgi:hypothetical protein
MRNLTHYELSILIKNEILILFENSIEKIDIRHVLERSKDIIKYCEEYNSLGEYDGAI